MTEPKKRCPCCGSEMPTRRFWPRTDKTGWGEKPQKWGWVRPSTGWPVRIEEPPR